jgi:ligand-binding sensor domain-containing protein
MRSAFASLSLRLSVALVATALLCGEELPIKTYTAADGLSRDRIGCIVQDPRGFLWFCAGGVLSRFDGYTFTSYEAKKDLPNQWVTNIQITRQGVYWVGTINGLFRLDANSPPPQRFERVPIGSNKNAQHINDLVQDQSGGLWVGTDDGLYRLEAASRSDFQPVDVGIPRRADGKRSADVLLRDRRGSLWIAADRLYRRTADGRITAFAADPFGTPYFAPGFGTLYEDREGRLWVGNGAGLYRLNPDAGPNDPIVTRLYTMKDGWAHDRVDALLETSEGRFWVWNCARAELLRSRGRTVRELYKGTRPERRRDQVTGGGS